MLQSEYDELKKTIETKLDNWDESKKIFAVVADIKLLAGFPKDEIKDILFRLNNDNISKLCSVITGNEKEYSISDALGVITCFLDVIFNKTAKDLSYYELLKTIMVIPEPKPEIKSQSQELNIQAS